MPFLTKKHVVILSDRDPQPAAFAGWGGGAKDLWIPALQINC
jgi:hypothetical protein